MRYGINFDKLINRFVPYYIGGRKLILYLQSIMRPIQQLNNEFVDYAVETRIEASMTSQIYKFEWFLNRKMSKYFGGKGQISIRNSDHLGSPMYYGDASIPQSGHMVMRYVSEGAENTTKLHYQKERSDVNSVSFIVVSPPVDVSKITKEQYNSILRKYIEKYRISGKTYIIKYISNE